MKGLLFKDLIQAAKYCRINFIISLIFVAMALLNENNIFFLFYPCLMAGTIPMTLYSYDERENWNDYCKILPYKPADIVSVKYITGIILTVLSVLVIALAETAGMLYKENFSFDMLLTIIIAALSISLVSPSLMMPFVFKLGAEKGRTAYFFAIVLAGSFFGVIQTFLSDEALPDLQTVLTMAAAGAAVLYALSWLISIKIYEKK